jgi:hypothetical protein
LHSVSINLGTRQYLAGYEPGKNSLFLPLLSEARVGDEVAVRIGIVGQTIRATVFGKVSLVRRQGRPAFPPGIELVLDPHSVAAAKYLASAARGEPITFKERQRRYAHERRLTLRHGAETVEASTLNVSERGCALRWPGRFPPVGDVVGIRIGDGMFAPTARAIVCWNHAPGPVESSVGLRILGEGRAGRAWLALVAEVARTGAPAA